MHTVATARSPATCPYRDAVFFDQENGKEYAHCLLLGELTGVQDTRLFKASRGACEVCCKRRAPNTEQINSVLASLLHPLASKIRDAGGMPGCDEAKARGLVDWARQNLYRLTPSNAATSKNARQTEPCFYLGEQTGEKNCADCKGTVRQKTFKCHHEAHEETILRECWNCKDHDVQLKTGEVRDWAVAVTTAPRDNPTLERSLESLAKAGWDTPLVFAEPGVARPDNVAAEHFVVRPRVYGAWPNWFSAAVELYMMQPKAHAYLLCQDDVLYARDIRPYLEATLWPAKRLGVVSLHTPSHRARVDWKGYHADNEGWRSWGAQAYVFSNPSLRALLRDAAVVNHRHRGPGEGKRNVDSVVGYWCATSGLDYVIHQPSLTQHIGETSTLWPDASLLGNRSASTFIGELNSVTDFFNNQDAPLKDSFPQ